MCPVLKLKITATLKVDFEGLEGGLRYRLPPHRPPPDPQSQSKVCYRKVLHFNGKQGKGMCDRNLALQNVQEAGWAIKLLMKILCTEAGANT